MIRTYRLVFMIGVLLTISTPTAFSHPTQFVGLSYSMVPAMNTDLIGFQYGTNWLWIGVHYGGEEGKDMAFISQFGLSYPIHEKVGLLGGISMGASRNCDETKAKNLGVSSACVTSQGTGANSLLVNVGVNAGLVFQIWRSLGVSAMYDFYNTTKGVDKGTNGFFQLGINYHFGK